MIPAAVFFVMLITKSCHEANFIVTGDTEHYHVENI